MLATYNSEILLGDIIEDSPMCTNVGICDIDCKDSAGYVMRSATETLRSNTYFCLLCWVKLFDRNLYT